MKNTYILLRYILAIAIYIVSLSGCKKSITPETAENERVSYITAVIDDSKTKTLHQYSNAALKTRWKSGDLIAVIDDYTKEVFCFSQTGTLDNLGQTSVFKPTKDGVFLNHLSSYTAYYPYSENLKYDISVQTGKLEDLHKYDIWSSNGYTGGVNHPFLFSPECTILRIPQGSLITSTDYTGNITLTFSGDAVNNVIDYKSDEQLYFQGDITIKTKVNRGKLDEDTYIAYVEAYFDDGLHPVHPDMYYLNSDRGDNFEFIRNNYDYWYGKKKIYTIDTKKHGYVQFEDQNFKRLMLADYDINGDDEISYAEAKKIGGVEGGSSISSYGGIEHFTNLKTLYIRGNNNDNLKELDLKNNPKLYRIDINATYLEKININNCPDIEYLYIRNCKLKSLDLAQNPKLKTLCCEGNLISELNLGNNKSLDRLVCHDNLIEKIVISPSLNEIYCQNNKLKTLNIKECEYLWYIDCSNNSIESIEWPLVNEVLNEIHCYNNNLVTMYLSAYNNLERIDCCNNSLKELLLPVNIQQLDCANNNLTNIDFSNVKTGLYLINCWGNSIKEIDFSKWGFKGSLVAWPMKNNSLKKVIIVKNMRPGYGYYYGQSSGCPEHTDVMDINPANYGTTIVEVD